MSTSSSEGMEAEHEVDEFAIGIALNIMRGNVSQTLSKELMRTVIKSLQNTMVKSPDGRFILSLLHPDECLLVEENGVDVSLQLCSGSNGLGIFTTLTDCPPMEHATYIVMSEGSSVW